MPMSKASGSNRSPPWTQISDRGRIAAHLKPLLGSRHVERLTPGDVERAFVAIRDGKTARDVKTRKRGRSRVRGGEGTARMAIRLLRAAINWAIGEGLVISNPCAQVRIGTDGTRDVILESVDDYRRLFETLDRMERERRLRSAVADAIRVIALTGARRGEVIGLRWAHVDLKRGLITLPPQSHKAGRRTGKARIIGLPGRGTGDHRAPEPGMPLDDLVFPPAFGEGTLSLSKPWSQIRAEANLPEGIGLHGLRHSLASHMAMAGAAAGEIMTALWPLAALDDAALSSLGRNCTAGSCRARRVGGDSSAASARQRRSCTATSGSARIEERFGTRRRQFRRSSRG